MSRPVCSAYGCVDDPTVGAHIAVPTPYGPLRAHIALCQPCAQVHLAPKLDTPTEAVA